MRESGILMPVSSLPGPYGIGCFGKEAFKFVDFRADAGQKIWQLLPLSPTGYGDSPYQSCSAFAGNPYFIDLDALKEEGLLTAAQLKAEPWGDDPKQVDYGTLYTSRYKVLRTAYAAWRKACKGLHGCSDYFPDDYYAFTLSNEAWLEDYALYMALKVANGMKNWVEWERPYRLRDKAALAAFAAENEEEIGFWKFVQYKFSTQWQAVKQYANDKGVQILGDIPIYVSADSVDAWVGGKLFELDAEGRFARVAGCPPHYCSADGQLWGRYSLSPPLKANCSTFMPGKVLSASSSRTLGNSSPRSSAMMGSLPSAASRASKRSMPGPFSHLPVLAVALSAGMAQ